MTMEHREEHEQLRRMARDFLEKECPSAHVRAMLDDERRYSPELWRRMAGLGWLGAIIPEQHGGTGLGFTELGIILQEMGRVLLPAPFVASTVLGCTPILKGESGVVQKQILPQVAGGAAILTGAYYEPDGWYDALHVRTTATQDGDTYRLNGVKVLVPWADAADHILVSAAVDGGLGIFLVPRSAPGVRITRTDTINWHPVGEVVLESVSVPREHMLLPGSDLIAQTIRRGTAAIAALQAGGAAKALEMTVEYANTRVAFGRPIGTFQALKHRMADLAVEVLAADALVAKAVRAIDEETGDEVVVVSMAKAWCSNTFRHVTNEALQIHGGIGFTWEHDVHLYLRAAQAYAWMMGDAESHLDVVAQQKFGEEGQGV